MNLNTILHLINLSKTRKVEVAHQKRDVLSIGKYTGNNFREKFAVPIGNEVAHA